MRHIIKTRFLTYFTIFTILVSGLIPVSASEIPSKTLGGLELKQSIEKDMTDNTISNDKITISNAEKQALNDNKILKQTIIKKDKNGNKKVAKYYAGAYINDDDSLVVQFTGDATKNNINDSIEDLSDSADVEIVKHSYNYILSQYEKDTAIMEKINNAVKNNSANDLEKAVSNNLVGIKLSQQNNCNIVVLKDVTKKAREEFFECFKDENVIFEKSSADEIVEHKTTIKPGVYFIVYIDGEPYYVGTVGARMSYGKADGSTIYGFLTAGHCVDYTGRLIYFYDGSKITKYGKVSLYKHSGCADAAFVKQTNTTNFSTSRYTAYSNSSGGTAQKYKACQNCAFAVLDYDVVEGATVYKCGAVTYLTKGKINSLSATGTSDGDSFKNLITATYKTKKGDSGSNVFTIHNSETHTYDVAGINMGTLGSDAVFTCLDRYDTYIINARDSDGFCQY